MNALVGDWTITAIASIQSGRPISFTDRARNLYFSGDPETLSASYSNDVSQPVFDIGGFYFHDAAVQTNGADDPVKQRNDQRIRLANNVRYFPHRISSLRRSSNDCNGPRVVPAIRLNRSCLITREPGVTPSNDPDSS